LDPEASLEVLNLNENKEFGVLSNEASTVTESLNYFNYLWSIDPQLLNIESVEKWKTEIKMSKPVREHNDTLPDYGISSIDKTLQNRRYFIKFFGTNDYRIDLSQKVTVEIKGGCSHFALSFSRNKKDSRPRRYKNGDVVFMAIMTNTHDYAIFGKAETVQHNDTRDVADSEDIKHIPWLEDWPILVRVKNPIYINSTLEKCPKMNDLINDLDYESFESTYKRFKRGEEKINPRNTLMQKGDVILSELGALWMEEKFSEALDLNGEVSIDFINKLYQGKKI